MSLPRISTETTEVGWTTSRRYFPYLIASFAISLVICWLFWFAAYFIPSSILVDINGHIPRDDAWFLTVGLGIFLATTVTPFYALLWMIDVYDRVKTDMDKVRDFFGEKSWGKIVKIVRKRN